jgi:hypothetical protein
MGGATASWDAEFRTSDEILDTGRPGLEFFARFQPMYDEAAAIVGTGSYRGQGLDQLRRSYDDLRGIDFSMMRVDAEHLRTAVESAENNQHNLDRYWGRLSSWTGSAAGAARQHRDRVDSLAIGFLDKAGKGSAAITGAVSAIEHTLGSYVRGVKSLDSDLCGGMTPEEVRGAIRAARGDVENADAYWFLAKLLDASMGVPTFGVSWLLDWMGYGASDQVERVRQQIADAARQSLANYIRQYDDKRSFFDRYTKAVREAVKRIYDTMLAAMKPMEDDAFRELTGGGGGNQGTDPSGSQPGRTPGVPPVPPGAPPGPPGSGQPPGGSPPVRPMPYPLPGGVEPPWMPGRQPQTVTIRNGDSTVTVSSPDGQGRVRVTVADGNGPPRSYDLDFGQSTTSTAATGPAGAGPVPPVPPPAGTGQAPGGTGPGLGVPPVGPVGGGAGGGARPGAGGRPGGVPTAPAPRLPSSLFPWTDKPVETLRPDEDGTVTIRDGDTTITVDPDENSDQVTLTLDDGKGHQTTYRLDYSDPAHPTLREGPAVEPSVFGPTGGFGSPVSPLPGMPVPHAGSIPGLDPIGVGGGGGGGGGGSLAGIGAMSGPAPGGVPAGGQLEQGSFTGQLSGGQGGAPGGPAPAAAGPAQGGGGMMGGGMPMGAMGAGTQGGEDKERGGNRWLNKEGVFADDPTQRERAVKAGGVIGEDKKK